MKIIKTAQHLQNVETRTPFDEREVTRAIRDAIIAEEDATKQYEVIVDSTKNKLVKKVLQDIANEEKVHVGELQKLLNILLNNEKNFIQEGMEEVEKMKSK
ncbi:MAG: ferritin family protein [bacterium]